MLYHLLELYCGARADGNAETAAEQAMAPGVVGWTLLSGGSPAAPRKPANFERSVAGCIEADFAANYLLQPIAITQQI